jgi:hypothetical protein
LFGTKVTGTIGNILLEKAYSPVKKAFQSFIPTECRALFKL